RSSDLLRNHRGETVEVQEFSATEAKNSFGRVLDTVFSQGMVAISKRDRPTAVILSLDTYEALLEAQQNPLDSLSDDFDHLLRRMQAPQMRTAMADAFGADADELGEAAWAAAQTQPAPGDASPRPPTLTATDA
ncbi:MAG: type II toxin-antitoxin system Phd/YefM family antitoxin, partial [Aquabacterium sp.]